MGEKSAGGELDFPHDVVAPGSEEEALLARVDPQRPPRHLAVIMDGNGRWAARRGKTRIQGHRAGAESVRETVESCARLGIEVLTLYAFSTENWQRPPEEINALMSLLSEFIRREAGRLKRNGISFRPLGLWRELPAKPVRDIQWAVEHTAGGRRMLLQVALNYGGRREIADACRQLAARCLEGKMQPEQINEQAIGQHMYNPGVPDPDLLIRTSGELRISNFLLWEVAYAELWVTDTLWPDFRLRHLLQALIDYQARERRYGGLGRKGDSK